MFTVYILYSITHSKPYVGYTNDIDRRMKEHNFTESTGFTLRYRPWTLIKTEFYPTKADAIKREKYLKTGKGREEIRILISAFLSDLVRYPPAAEKD